MRCPPPIHWFRVATTGFLAVAIGCGVSCQTYYDAEGNPVQAVDPAAATALTAAGVLAGAAIANDGPPGRGPGGPGGPSRPGAVPDPKKLASPP